MISSHIQQSLKGLKRMISATTGRMPHDDNLLSFRNRSGRNLSGSGYRSWSCVIALCAASEDSGVGTVRNPLMLAVPYVDQNRCTCGNKIPFVFVVSYAAMSHAERSSIVPSEELFDDRVNVRQRIPICEGREPIEPDHAIELCSRFLLYVWVERESRKEALERGILLSTQFSRQLASLEHEDPLTVSRPAVGL